MDDVTKYAQSLMNEVAVFAHRRVFYDTPYRTGALARGISDVGSYPNGAMFSLLTQFTQYGAVLNELPVIHYRLVNKYTGKVCEGEYVNRHFNWINNAADKVANGIVANFPNITRTI